jgi:hypothetical protein
LLVMILPMTCDISSLILHFKKRGRYVGRSQREQTINLGTD